ncbi:LysR family transcriptional regulator [Burkholderia gladioli]|uniref:LysR family transcriptional regulator n=1 Tax=Burkholderia gladioli TaxID=28095 RepID=UPI00163E40FA|nr:LysR family transcriptional regulator [Burkholderia gladioli]
MDTLVSMQVFRHIVEIGSFVGAAERMGMSSAMASKHVAHLESRLDARLLHRTTRRVSLTEAGREYYERVVPALIEIDEASQSVNTEAIVPHGRLRVVSPSSFGLRHLVGAVTDYTARYPEVNVDVAISDRVLDPADERYDIAILVTPSSTKPASPFARPLATAQILFVASPAYLAENGTPATLTDLAAHNILQDSNGAGPLDSIAREAAIASRVALNSNLSVNQPEALRIAAVNGAGIALLGTDVAGDDIDAGHLVPLLRDVSPTRRLSIHATLGASPRASTTSRSFVDFLAERFAQRPLCASLDPVPAAAPMALA